MQKSILIRPLLTEKLTVLQEKHNQYSFEVNASANKIQIKDSVESKYNVEVATVNTSNKEGRVKQQFTKKGVLVGKKPDVKKAIVKLKQGFSIDFLQNS